VRRRDFITLVGASLAGRGPLAARAQEAAMPAIGYLSQGSLELDAVRLTGFRRGLNEGGYVEGKNVTIEYRGAGYWHTAIIRAAASAESELWRVS